MDYKRILTIQDISCVGQCSLTVALPIISACGVETAILPSAVLSNHTAFPAFTFKDLTDEIPNIKDEWARQNIKFSAVYTGYLGSAAQVDHVKSIMNELLEDKAFRIVDPAMADHGRLYTGFNMEFVQQMKSLCQSADVILPNITEACLLTDTPYREDYDIDYITTLFEKLSKICNRIVLTGVSFNPHNSGVAVYDNGAVQYYEHKKVGNGCHGTGDVYASAFVGAIMNGHSLYSAAKTAADFTLLCIENTINHKEHWYGVRFEPVIKELIKML